MPWWFRCIVYFRDGNCIPVNRVLPFQWGDDLSLETATGLIINNHCCLNMIEKYFSCLDRCLPLVLLPSWSWLSSMDPGSPTCFILSLTSEGTLFPDRWVTLSRIERNKNDFAMFTSFFIWDNLAKLNKFVGDNLFTIVLFSSFSPPQGWSLIHWFQKIWGFVVLSLIFKLFPFRPPDGLFV